MLIERITNHTFEWCQNSERQKMIDRILNSESSDGNRPLQPTLWLHVQRAENHECLVYFVNDSSEIIKYVKPTSFGYLSTGDGTATLINNNNRIYHNVLPKEAVLVDKFHLVYDSDSQIGLSIELDSHLTGSVRLSTPTTRGTIEETILYSEDQFNSKVEVEFIKNKAN